MMGHPLHMRAFRKIMKPTSERQKAHLVKARAARRIDRFKAAQLGLDLSGSVCNTRTNSNRLEFEVSTPRLYWRSFRPF